MSIEQNPKEPPSAEQIQADLRENSYNAGHNKINDLIRAMMAEVEIRPVGNRRNLPSAQIELSEEQ